MGDYNGKVTQEACFEKQLDTQKQMANMEISILTHITEELKPVHAVCNQVENNTKRIDMQEKKSNIFDAVLGIATAIAAALSWKS